MSRAVVRVAVHFRQMVGDLGPFGRLVVDEGDGAGAKFSRSAIRRTASGLRPQPISGRTK